MHELLSWIRHDNKQIIYADWRKLKGDEFVAAVDGLIEVYDQHEPDSLLVLIDIRDAYANREVKDRMKYANTVSAANKIAGVGVEGIKRVIANYVRKGIYFAKSTEDAKEWLVS